MRSAFSVIFQSAVIRIASLRKELQSMKILVFGASGLTGGRVVEVALKNGHQVAVLTRDSSKFSNSNLEIIEGSATSSADIEKALRSVDAVIHCLGVGAHGKGTATSLVSDSVKVVLTEMQKTGAKRLVCMSNVGAGGSGPWFYRRVVLPTFLRWLQPIIEDKNTMEAALRNSSVEWISVRLPYIVSGPAKPVRTSKDGRDIGFSITADSAAQFLLNQLTESKWLRQTPSISN
jgi:uncharacterized protein YbjT (DUF2867 family)